MSGVKWLGGDDPFGFKELSRFNQGLLVVLIVVFGFNVLFADWLTKSPRIVLGDGIVALILAGLLITARTTPES